MELDADFLRHILSRIEWKALAGARKLDSGDFLRRFSRAQLGIQVEESALVCHRFTVKRGTVQDEVRFKFPPLFVFFLFCWVLEFRDFEGDDGSNYGLAVENTGERFCSNMSLIIMLLFSKKNAIVSLKLLYFSFDTRYVER